jgi:hypothetical protein
VGEEKEEEEAERGVGKYVLPHKFTFTTLWWKTMLFVRFSFFFLPSLLCFWIYGWERSGMLEMAGEKKKKKKNLRLFFCSLAEQRCETGVVREGAEHNARSAIYSRNCAEYNLCTLLDM